MSESRTRPSRRTVLLVGVGLLAGLGAFAARRRGAAGARERAKARLAGWFARPERVAALGERYLASHPDESDRGRLLDLLTEAIGDPSDFDSDAALRARVAAVVQAEFATGRTTRLASWVLSRTEARLAALASPRVAGHA